MRKILSYLNINSGDHINKKYLYMLFLFIVIIGSLVIRSTYAKFTSGYTTEDDIVGFNFDFNIGISNIEEYEEIRVSSYDVYSFNVEITNSTSNTMYYGVWYRIPDSGVNTDSIVIARLEGTDTTTSGSVNSNDKLTVSVIVKNRTDKDIKIDIGVASSSNSTNDIEYLDGRKLISGTDYLEDYYYDSSTTTFISAKNSNTKITSTEFSYTGGSQTFTAPYNGYYKLEAWGASGGGSTSPGKGAYTTGVVYLKKFENVYIYVGGKGSLASANSTYASGGYNGGGSSNYSAGAGGGATDIRLVNGSWNDTISLTSRIMVASGGGGEGAFTPSATFGGSGGSLTGIDGGDYSTTWAGGGHGGTQISGGEISTKFNVSETDDVLGTNGSFALGGNGGAGVPNSHGSGAGGSGYYGGAGGSGRNGGGAGGSSYISGYKGSVSAGNKQKFKVVYTTSSVTIYDQYNNAISSGTPTSLIQNIARTSNYIGKSNWSADSYFNGQIYKLKLSLANGTVVLDYDFTKNSIKDFSGNGYDGVLMNGASLKYTGKEYCLYLDGVDDYLQIPTLPSSIDLASGFTIEFEVIWNKLLSSSRIIDIGNGENSDNFVISTYVKSDQIYVATYQGVTTTHSSFATSSVIKTNGTNYGSDKSVCETGDSDVTCSYHYSGKVFNNSTMIAGNASMPTHDGTSTMTGNSGNGYAKVTLATPELLGIDDLTIISGEKLSLSSVKCVDNGSGCEIIKVNPSDTSSLSIGNHEINFYVKDNAGIIYKFTSNLAVVSS